METSLRPPTTGIGSIFSSATTTAAYEIALTVKRSPAPNVGRSANGAKSRPPSTGPMICGPLNAAELRPMALIRSRSGTSRGTIACRVGVSNAKIVELSAASSRISAMLILSVIASPARIAAVTAAQN